MCSGSTLTWLKWLSRICVPSETKHAFNEWKLPPTRSGDGYVASSLTTSISSCRFLGTATTWGVLEAELFQFLKVVALAISSYLRIREPLAPALEGTRGEHAPGVDVPQVAEEELAEPGEGGGP